MLPDLFPPSFVFPRLISFALAGGRGHLNKLVSEHELAGSNHSELSTGTPEGAGNQGSLSIDISDTEISQLGTNLQNTSHN